MRDLFGREAELAEAIPAPRPGIETSGLSGQVHRQKKGEKHQSPKTAVRPVQEMAIIAEIGRLIRSTLNIDEVYERFAAEVQKLLPFDSLVIYLYNSHKNTLCAAYVSGVDIDGRRKRDSPSLWRDR